MIIFFDRMEEVRCTVGKFNIPASFYSRFHEEGEVVRS